MICRQRIGRDSRSSSSYSLFFLHFPMLISFRSEHMNQRRRAVSLGCYVVKGLSRQSRRMPLDLSKRSSSPGSSSSSSFFLCSLLLLRLLLTNGCRVVLPLVTVPLSSLLYRSKFGSKTWIRGGPLERRCRSKGRGSQDTTELSNKPSDYDISRHHVDH